METLIFELSEPADNAQVVFSVRRLLEQMGFDKTRQYLVASAVSELSTNIIRYGGKGSITLRQIRLFGQTGFEVIARDSGPGIEDIQKALAENYSTGNGLGQGLPSVKRIMDTFDIQSGPGRGTVVHAIKWLSHGYD